MYRGGFSINKLAKHFKTSRDIVRGILKRAGIIIRMNGWNK